MARDGGNSISHVCNTPGSLINRNPVNRAGKTAGELGERALNPGELSERALILRVS